MTIEAAAVPSAVGGQAVEPRVGEVAAAGTGTAVGFAVFNGFLAGEVYRLIRR